MYRYGCCWGWFFCSSLGGCLFACGGGRVLRYTSTVLFKDTGRGPDTQQRTRKHRPPTSASDSSTAAVITQRHKELSVRSKRHRTGATKKGSRGTGNVYISLVSADGPHRALLTISVFLLKGPVPCAAKFSPALKRYIVKIYIYSYI